MSVMSRPHLRLAPHGGYLLQLGHSESWWIQPNVEPFRTESRKLEPAQGHVFRPDDSDTAGSLFGARVRLEISEERVRDDLAELERLGMARRLP
jgi:hypothetical protein